MKVLKVSRILEYFRYIILKVSRRLEYFRYIILKVLKETSVHISFILTIFIMHSFIKKFRNEELNVGDSCVCKMNVNHRTVDAQLTVYSGESFGLGRQDKCIGLTGAILRNVEPIEAIWDGVNVCFDYEEMRWRKISDCVDDVEGLYEDTSLSIEYEDWICE